MPNESYPALQVLGLLIKMSVVMRCYGNFWRPKFYMNNATIQAGIKI